MFRKPRSGARSFSPVDAPPGLRKLAKVKQEDVDYVMKPSWQMATSKDRSSCRSSKHGSIMDTTESAMKAGPVVRDSTVPPVPSDLNSLERVPGTTTLSHYILRKMMEHHDNKPVADLRLQLARTYSMLDFHMLLTICGRTTMMSSRLPRTGSAEAGAFLH